MINELTGDVPFTMQEFNTFIDLLSNVDDCETCGKGRQSDDLIALTLILKRAREELK